MKLRKYAIGGDKRYKQRWWGRFFAALTLLIMVVGVIGSTTTPAVLAGPALDQPGQGDQGHQDDEGHQGDKGDRGDKGDKREVPNVAGLSQADAKAALKAADLKVGAVTEESSDSVPAGLVISQTPAAGEPAREEDRVDLVISSGPAPSAATEPAAATVPDLTNNTQTDAEAALTAAGLVLGTVTEQNSDTVPAGAVISQSLEAGATANLGTPVDIVVSSGPAQIGVTVPDLTNTTQTDAEAALTAAGLVLGTVSQQSSDTAAAGAVISQNPAAGSTVDAGAAVDIVVSSGPAVITVTVPDVVSLPQANAEAAIVAASLVTGTVTLTSSDTIAAGLVLEQNPAAGSTVDPGSAVDLVVSSGPAVITVTVPDVVNLPRADAEAAIVAAGLITGSTALTPSDTITAGLVLEQNPAAGSTVDPGSAVDIVVSQGPVANIVVAAGPTPVDMTGWTDLTLDVISARTEGSVNQGDPVTQYKYIINVDNTGTTDQRGPADGCSPEVAGYPGTCFWTSIAGVPGSSPIFTQGNQDDFANGGGILIPDGRYLISVLADGFKLDGIHFTIPAETHVTVELQPNPLPTATIQAAVFEDNAITNGAPDVPAERGLAGFQGHIADYLGEITTDVFGDPLCGNGVCLSQCYVVDGGVDIGTVPPVDGAGHCPIVTAGNPGFADGLIVEGKLEIPNLGPNRYALSITPPDGTNWIQTTTLEGNHDWDSWVMEGATGLDTEFVVAGEPFPFAIFGYVRPTGDLPAGPTGHIKGVVDIARIYIPAVGGLGLPGTIWGGLTGARLDGPISNPWISLSDLTNGDQAIWVGQGDANGAFDIANVPDGNYTLTWWDEPQNYILDLINVTVTNGEVVDMGILPLTGWWTKFSGYVFNDTNRNGVRDPGEPGVPNFTLTMRKRENSLMDRGATAVTTDANGYYVMENAYPMTQWLVMEAYNDLFYTTGITYQADNQPTPTTVLGAGVDVSVLPIIGLSGTMDWGVHAYDATGRNGIDPRNGGIVGTVSYDTTRNELDPQYAAVEDWQPSVPGLTVNLYDTVDCPLDHDLLGIPCDPSESYILAPDGSYAKGALLNTYVTETWERPTENCVPRNVDGNPLSYPGNQQVTNSSSDCLEGPLMGVQFGPYATDQGTPDANFGAAVDGNYGFGDGCFNGTLDASDPANPVCVGGTFDPLPGGHEYLVEVETAYDQTGMRPLFQVTREEDINVANGDQFVPQVPPPACAGPLHTVDVNGFGTDGYGEIVGDGGVTNNLPVGVTVPASTPVDNATFVEIGASPFEGMPRPLCNVKLVQLNNGKSIAPAFNVFTDVPVPGRFWGLIVDDLNFSSNPKSLLYGEKAGVSFAPVGIYDWTNRLVHTVESDYNGLWDVLLPSTNRISCPTPSGVCANLYRFVGNDPGIPGRLNPNYNPQFRTISAEFEAFPGLIVPADLAPTQVGVTVQIPGSQFNAPVSCTLDTATPQLFAVSQPYVTGSGSFGISGVGFGASPGQVTLNGVSLPTANWTDTHIDVTAPAGTASGPQQLSIQTAAGQGTINGLTFHVLGSGSAPFPSTAVLDNFNRANSSNLGANWLTDGGGYNINNNQLRVRTGGNIRDAWWVAGTPFGADQEAYFTFIQVSPQSGANEQGLLLKYSGGTNPGSNAASWVEVALNNSPANTVRIRTKSAGSGTITTRATLTGVTFTANDQLGARAQSDGTIIAYKNGVEIGRTTYAPSGSWTGRIGVRFEGTGTNNTGQASIDNFGGGNITAAGGSYNPTVYEVGPGRTFSTIQSAIDQSALDAANPNYTGGLVVVYPGQPDFSNPRANPRGAYYENLIVTSPVKLQGVGPGGFQGNTYVPGSNIDGGAFGGDTALADAWRTKMASLTWDGNQTVYDGEIIYILAHNGQFTANFNAAIDGFDLRGGDQMGFPNNINQIGGGPTGLAPNAVTQGGAIFANAYVQYLQITNNVVQNNGGSYGTIRIGTPDLPAPETNQHNENVRIANNRIIANGGTNLAGGIGLFAGADNYEVAYNDICGNFSAEYGGGLSVYGYSPNGKIHHNRIYLNSSYDEGGGIMIAGQLPADPNTLSPGSGPVDIDANYIQANMANDDGGGLRFLMAGNFPMNVTNNIIANNISTHEGGGIGLNDAPNVRVVNNTIMKNLTTATAVTSNGLPAPAGLSTSLNSNQLQATLPGGSPLFSNPLLFNNNFWDNRAGTRAGATVTGLGIAGDASPIYRWDLGTADGSGLVAPTNSILQVNTGTIPSATNLLTDPLVMTPYDISVAFAPWRVNPNFVGATMVAADLPPSLMGNFHLQTGSPAINLGAASKSGVNAPAADIDGDTRPAGAAFDSGADEADGGGGGGNPPPTAQLYFSTASSATSVPGVTAPYNNADVYAWNGGSSYARILDAVTAGIGGVNVDAIKVVDATHIYMSFESNTTLPGVGAVQDEDIVYYNNGAWSLFLDGTASGVGLGNSSAEDINAFDILPDNSVIVSTVGNNVAVPGLGGTYQNRDVLRCVPSGSPITSCSWSFYFDGSDVGLGSSTSENITGVAVKGGNIYLTTAGNFSITGLSGNNEDVFVCNSPTTGTNTGCGSFTMFFDGNVNGMGGSLDAISLP